MMWKDSYQIGVPRIDEQHKELFRMTEELVGAAQNGITAEACPESDRLFERVCGLSLPG